MKKSYPGGVSIFFLGAMLLLFSLFHQLTQEAVFIRYKKEELFGLLTFDYALESAYLQLYHGEPLSTSYPVKDSMKETIDRRLSYAFVIEDQEDRWILFGAVEGKKRGHYEIKKASGECTIFSTPTDVHDLVDP